MNKKISLVLALALLGSMNLFAKATTDIEAGFIYGHGSMVKDEEQSGITIKDITTDACGLNFGCDVEITEHFGLFLDFGFLFPNKTEINAEYNGTSYSISDDDKYAVKLELNALIGPEFVYYVNDDFKLRLGAGYNVAGLVLSVYDGTTVESDMLYGLGTKFDATYQFSNVVGLNFGCDMSFLFGGSYDTTTSTSSGDVKDSGSLDDFTFFIEPNASLIFHIGGSH